MILIHTVATIMDRGAEGYGRNGRLKIAASFIAFFTAECHCVL